LAGPLRGLRVEVPEIPVEERVQLPADKTALIIVDMQNDFVKPGGSLRVPTAEKTIGPIRSLLEKARKHAVLTIFTQDTHYLFDPEFEIWGRHVVKGTWGWQIIDELKPIEGEIVVEKTRYDGFYGTPVDDILRVNGIENVVVVGTVANICVLHTASSAAIRWYKVYMPMDAVSALNEFDYYLTLRQLTFLYRGIVVEKAENIEFIGEGKWKRSSMG
jgi:nicotinamidase-related amidase